MTSTIKRIGFLFFGLSPLVFSFLFSMFYLGSSILLYGGTTTIGKGPSGPNTDYACIKNLPGNPWGNYYWGNCTFSGMIENWTHFALTPELGALFSVAFLYFILTVAFKKWVKAQKREFYLKRLGLVFRVTCYVLLPLTLLRVAFTTFLLFNLSY